MKTLITLLALGQIAIASTQAAVIYYPTNNGFETPNVVSNGQPSYGYFDKPTSGWALSYSGIAANGALELENATNGNSDGTTSTFGQAAYIGGGGSTPVAGYIRGDVLVSISGTASVTLSLEAASLSSTNPVNVFMGLSSGGSATLLGTFTPTSDSSFTSFTTTTPFEVTAGTSYRIVIYGTQTGTGASRTFVDNVSVAVIPEPGTAALGTLGLMLTVLARRKKRISNVGC